VGTSHVEEEAGVAGHTVGGAVIPDRPDLARMRADRHARLVAEMGRQGVDAVVLSGSGAVSYAVGAATPATDSGRSLLGHPVAVVLAGDAHPHLFTPFPEGAPSGLPADHVHGGLCPDDEEGSATLARFLAGAVPSGAQVAFDDLPHPLRARVGPGSAMPVQPRSASAVLGPARIAKTPDELACIRRAQRINEQAMSDVQILLRPGVRQSDLTACFLRRVFELGATANCLDPIWQPMPRSLGEGPWTTHGGVAFPVPSSDAFLREGDVIWVDTGISYEGYASDFGRTWIVGADPRPSARQEAQFELWRAVMDAVLGACRPGATGGDLCRAATGAAGGVRPWIEHFYLAHGVGTESAEMPLIGTDLGEAFDESTVLAPGMVLVLEPVVWDDGAGGYRSEDVFAVTDDGWAPLSGHPFDPYGAA